MNVGEPGEWTHGWQCLASSVSDTFRRALLSDPYCCSSGALEVTLWTQRSIAPHLFRVLVLERLHLPLPIITEAVCEGCGAPVDIHGQNRAACMRTERVKKTAIATERVLARVKREAEARVRFNAFLRDMNVGVPATDTRRIEVLAQDLPCFAGVQLAVDITLRSALTSNGEAQPKAENTDGAVLSEARHDKERCYPELARSGRCRIVVVGIDWSDEVAEVVRQLAHARARDVPCHLSRPAEVAWERRWTRMLSAVCGVSFAASLAEPEEQRDLACRMGGGPPTLSDLHAEEDSFDVTHETTAHKKKRTRIKQKRKEKNTTSPTSPTSQTEPAGPDSPPTRSSPRFRSKSAGGDWGRWLQVFHVASKDDVWSVIA